MTDTTIIKKYFPELTELQISRFDELGPFYKEWNQKINVISRKDIDQIYLHHILHSLSIAKFMPFKEGTQILDLGTGGGFPGIPLAIMFPESNFLLIDGKAKKISVVNELVNHLELKNVKAIHKRSEDIKYKFDFVLARAVTQLDKLIPLSLRLVSQNHSNIFPNGLIALKGGNLKDEIKAISKWHAVEKASLQKYFQESYFEEKFLLYIQA